MRFFLAHSQALLSTCLEDYWMAYDGTMWVECLLHLTRFTNNIVPMNRVWSCITLLLILWQWHAEDWREKCCRFNTIFVDEGREEFFSSGYAAETRRNEQNRETWSRASTWSGMANGTMTRNCCQVVVCASQVIFMIYSKKKIHETRVICWNSRKLAHLDFNQLKPCSISSSSKEISSGSTLGIW